MSEDKNSKIKQSLIETKMRRRTQKCRVFEFKINTKSLSKSNFEKLKMMFVECKWLYNYLLGLDDIKTYSYKQRKITGFDKDKNKIERELTIPQRFIQSVQNQLTQNIVALSNKKKKGKNKVGKLKFKSEYNSINLNQYGQTHDIRENNRLKILGIKKPIKVFGLEQIKNKDYEFANAKLVHKPSGYYILLTCYENLKSSNFDNSKQEKKDVGLDFGIKTHITTSDNEKFNITIEESERLKGLQKKFARQIKGSNNRYKTLQKIKVEYEKIENKKKDKTNKLVHYLCSNYSNVYMQDEMIANWHKGLFGKQVQHSCLGMIKQKLSEQNNVFVIDRSYPSTKLCYKCGTLHKDITLKDRTFKCPTCGFEEERDLKASKTILFIGQCKKSYAVTEHNSTDVERMSVILDSLNLKCNSR